MKKAPEGGLIMLWCGRKDLNLHGVAPDGLECPYVSGVPFLTGVGRPAAEQEILSIMAR